MKGRNEVISKELMAAINDTLDRNQQVLLFINRRGFSSAIVCPACSRVLECRRCSRSLTYHKAGDNAVCHYCGYFENAPGICPSCGCVEIKHLGLGTERIVEEVQRLVPNAKMLQMDSDRINSQTRLDNALKAIRDKKVDVIIGTQMISKGHDFPGLTLVGIIHAEQLMYMPDFRASERTFQQVVQVAGRAGRTMAGTKVILQTLIPSHPLIEFMSRHDYLSMMQKECEDRRQNDFPPFSFMARCIFSSQKDGIAEEYSKKTSRTLTRPDVKILGPSPAPIELLRNSHRWNFFLTSKNRNSLHACLDSIEKIKFPSSLKVKIDVDPYDML
jgi:primosomal protein N' (replication factor Y)